VELLQQFGLSFGDDVTDQLRCESRPAVFEGRRGSEIADGILRVARTPYVGDDGLAAGHIWTIRDVTQQKLADEMRTQFVNSATHELRTPLANIKAYAETLALNDITDLENQKEFLNIINSEATRLARFVDELLNVSRMESGSLSLSRQLTDVARMLNEAVQKVRPQIEQKQQSFETVIPRKLPELEMDKDKVMAAIVNLLGNAAKYTPEGGRLALHVTCENGELKIAVEDTGIGIAADELPKIAGKFFRSEDPRVRDIPGSGLGLSLVQEVARLHGGNLSIHSELNKGSRFTLTLPAV
jgi:signal transduction histidine kinase